MKCPKIVPEIARLNEVCNHKIRSNVMLKNSSALKIDHSMLRPAHLRCEYLANPSGLDVESPRLSWILDAGKPAGRGTMQLWELLENALFGLFGDITDMQRSQISSAGAT
jgi:hypothetical protein